MADGFSAFTVFSFGGGDGASRGDDIKGALLFEIEDVKQRISILMGKMDELYVRPRMPYTQGASNNDELQLESDGNVEPAWTPIVTFATESVITTNPTFSIPPETLATPTSGGGGTSDTTSTTSSSSSSSSSESSEEVT